MTVVGLDLPQSMHRVRSIETYANQIASGASPSDLAKTHWINIYELNNAVATFNALNDKIDKIKASRVPGARLAHLNYLRSFTERQQQNIKVEAIARAMMVGGDVGKLFLKTEEVVEGYLCAAANYRLTNYGIWPDYKAGFLDIAY